MSHRALSDKQFSFVFHPEGFKDVHTVEVWKKKEMGEWAHTPPLERNTWAGSDVDPGHVPVGSMSWHRKTGEVRGIYALQPRKGIATAMWHEGHRLAGAGQADVEPKHSPNRSPAGDAWARAVGGELP